MTIMSIPTGYGILTAGLVAVCVVFLVAAGWSRKKAAVGASLGMCTITSIFVIDVITNGTVMGPRLALILVGTGLVLMVPLGAGMLRAVRKSGRSANPPDSARRSAAG
jgi:hypothetical protein